MTMYEKFCQLDIDGKLIGIANGNLDYKYFCTPVNAKIIGWENSIHYCFIDGYKDMVFAVNPESCIDTYVYPLSANFEDFLRLILSCGSTTAIEQIVCWSKEQFEQFVTSEYNTIIPKQQKVLDTIRISLNLTPMDSPYEYVKSLQNNFTNSHNKIIYSKEYYDVLGLDAPADNQNNTEPTEFTSVTFAFRKSDK